MKGVIFKTVLAVLFGLPASFTAAEDTVRVTIVTAKGGG